MKVTKDEKNKDKALEQVLADIEKQFGAGAIMKLGDNEHMNVDVTSSGSIAIDVALGVGGYPKGRIIEIYGPESSPSSYCGSAKKWRESCIYRC